MLTSGNQIQKHVTGCKSTWFHITTNLDCSFRVNIFLPVCLSLLVLVILPFVNFWKPNPNSHDWMQEYMIPYHYQCASRKQQWSVQWKESPLAWWRTSLKECHRGSCQLIGCSVMATYLSSDVDISKKYSFHLSPREYRSTTWNKESLQLWYPYLHVSQYEATLLFDVHWIFRYPKVMKESCWYIHR